MHNCNILKIYQTFIQISIAPSTRTHDLRTMSNFNSVVLSLYKDGRNPAIVASFGLQRG